MRTTSTALQFRLIAVICPPYISEIRIKKIIQVPLANAYERNKFA